MHPVKINPESLNSPYHCEELPLPWCVVALVDVEAAAGAGNHVLVAIVIQLRKHRPNPVLRPVRVHNELPVGVSPPQGQPLCAELLLKLVKSPLLFWPPLPGYPLLQ
jgi:hypothetical protein